MRRFTPQLRSLQWLVTKPIAHRGLHKAADGVIENTASAFAAAMAGSYAIECDLQLSGDGEAMVFHDETLERLMEADGLLKQRPARELRQIAFKSGKDRMQTLGELLDQVSGRVPLVIELKSHWDGDVALAARALAVLKSYAGPFALMSFDPDLVAAVASLSPQTVRGITADRTVDDYYKHLPFDRRLELRSLSHLERSQPHFVSYYFRDLPFAPVQQIRAAGHPVITWTIRSPAEEAIARRYSDQVTFEGYLA